jgi:hypothetical protein
MLEDVIEKATLLYRVIEPFGYRFVYSFFYWNQQTVTG